MKKGDFYKVLADYSQANGFTFVKCAGLPNIRLASTVQDTKRSDIKTLTEYGQIIAVRDLARGLAVLRIASDGDDSADDALVDLFGLIHKCAGGFASELRLKLFVEVLLVFSSHGRVRPFIQDLAQNRRHWSRRVTIQSWIADLQHEDITSVRWPIAEVGLRYEYRTEFKSRLFREVLFRRTQDDQKEAAGDGKFTSLIVDCPGCAAKIRLQRVAGKGAVTCPTCRNKFEVRVTTSGHVHVYQRASPGSSQNRRDASDDPYVVLQIAPTATVEEIKSAFRKRMQEYHPDRVASLGIRLRTVAEEEAKRINDAYERLLRKR